MQLKQRQKGFTLVEIAVVLVIIGLLLGGVLKGQELISSARVRNLADQQSGIQAAFYGFQDRYSAIPGDMDSNAAADAIGESATGYPGGDADGRLGDASTNSSASGVSSGWTEPNALWVHLSDAGFISGTYTSNTTNAPSGPEHGPQNVFNGNLVMARNADYENEGTTTPPERLVLYMGRRVPVDIARELDTKLDDGQPQTGVLRSAPDGSGAYQGHADCTTAGSGTSTSQVWNVAGNSQECNPVYLF